MNYTRLKWACRRGMLELDLLFEPFVQNVYPNTDLKTQQAFEKLLEQQDQDLWNWLVKRDPAPNELQPIIDRILNHARHPDNA